jgi:hypothetical protein
MDAGPHRRRLAFFLDVVAAMSNEGPGMAIGHHVGPKVATIDVAKRDCAAVPIDAPGFAGDVAFANQRAQVFGCCSSRRPSIGARLARLGRVDSPKAMGHAIDLERITIDHAGRLSEGGRGSEREGSDQGGQFHWVWLMRDYGDNAALRLSRRQCRSAPALAAYVPDGSIRSIADRQTPSAASIERP